MRIVKAAVLAVVGAASVTGVVCWANYEKWVSIPNAQALIAAQLRDPSSTQFRNSRITKSGWLCGELNSKNGNGGYVGFKKFVSNGKDSGFYVEGYGVLGKRTTEQFIAVMDEQIKILKDLNRRQSENPNSRIPSERDLEEMANAAVFDSKWREICE